VVSEPEPARHDAPAVAESVAEHPWFGGESMEQETFEQAMQDLLPEPAEEPGAEPTVGGTLVALLQEANQLRNDWTGHGGIVGERQAEERHALLRSHLVKLREHFGNCWRRYEFIRPRTCAVRAGAFHNHAHRLMGSNPAFEVIQRQTTHPLEADQLHFIADGESTALQLLPLIKVMPSPATEENACYFYNRVEGDGIRLVSYHFEAESDVVRSFSDVSEALKQTCLLDPGGSRKAGHASICP